MSKLVIHYDSGTSEEVVEEEGFIALWWEDRKEGTVKMVAPGLKYADHLRLIGIIVGYFADKIEEATLNDEDQLILDQHRVIQAVKEIFHEP